ncbi:MAG: IS110 family transposase [Methanophagales archaeon]|nr:IS110 family transposase [Methanophagales archaeon]
MGYHNALLMQSELGEIKRFSNPKSMVSYSGLAPMKQSGDYTEYGLWGSAPRPRKHSRGLTMCRKRREEMNVEIYGFTERK